MPKIPELVCPAGNLPALKTAVDNGADTVYMGLKDATNARNFPGLNFDMKSAQEGVAYAHARGRNVLMAINTFAQAGQIERWHRARMSRTIGSCPYSFETKLDRRTRTVCIRFRQRSYAVNVLVSDGLCGNTVQTF